MEIPTTGNDETLAGYVPAVIQRIPRQGENIETDNLHIMILDAEPKRIKRGRMQKMH